LEILGDILGIFEGAVLSSFNTTAGYISLMEKVKNDNTFCLN